jgi:glutamate dehydrogenase/leucine dehydrogenase/CBS domain-containing protein
MIPKELSTLLEHKDWSEKLLDMDNGFYVEFSEGEDGENYEKILRRLGISHDALGPERIVFMWSKDEKVGGYLVIDNLAMGKPSLGGIRMKANLALIEIANLARGMTLKNAAANLPFGGGKGGIVADPRVLVKKGEKEEVIRTYARLIKKYVDIYNPGPDVGMNDFDMKTIAIENGIDNVVSKTIDMGGNQIDEWGAAAGGVVIAIDMILKNLHKLKNLPQFKNRLTITDPADVLIQGFGAVGANVAKYLTIEKLLSQTKTEIKITGISDEDGYLYCSNGLDIRDILNRVSQRTVTRKYFNSLPDGQYSKKENDIKFSNARDDLLQVSGDILVPASPVPNYIGLDETYDPSITIDKAGNWLIIVEGANTYQNEIEKRYEREKLERILYRRGTFIATDFLVNTGGVIFAAFEKLIPTPQNLQPGEDILGNKERMERWLKEHGEEFEELAEKRRKAAQDKRKKAITDNMNLLIDKLVKHYELLPCQVAEHIAIERIINRTTSVRNVMIEALPKVEIDTSLKSISEILVRENIGLLPVVTEDGKLLGIVTEWDVAKAIANEIWKTEKDITAKEIMIPLSKVITAHLGDNILDTIKKLKAYNISRMPVIDDQRHVIGLITTDILVNKTLFRLLHIERIMGTDKK